MKFQLLVNDAATEPWAAEHGLSLLLETNGEAILFDTGAGDALSPNARRAKIDGEKIEKIIISHGHYDHTGGLPTALSLAPNALLYYAPGILRRRFNLAPEKPPREISIPAAARAAFDGLDESRRHEIGRFTQIGPGLFLTGPIPRQSGETTGGPFFLDADRTMPDEIADEQALLAADAKNRGVLIQGCSHAGILNTVTCCRVNRPDVSIKTIVGGLHLQSAPVERLEAAVEFLQDAGVTRLVLMHCTGENAVDYFQKNFRGEVETVRAGESVEC